MQYTSVKYALANRWDPRHLETVKHTVNPQPGERVLEVGCGRGHLVQHLAAEGIDITGADANPEAVANAVSDQVACMPAEALTFDDDQFDVVMSFHMIEHVDDLDATLAEMARVLRPGGRLLLVYPAEPIRGLYAIPSSVIMTGHPFAARKIHCRSLRPKTLRPALTAQGLKETESNFSLLSSPQYETQAVLPVPAVHTPQQHTGATHR